VSAGQKPAGAKKATSEAPPKMFRDWRPIKSKSELDAGHTTPGGIAISDSEASYDGASP
jgi:hypothetical protein